MSKGRCELGDVVWSPSPNHSERRDVERPDMVVLHYTAMDDAHSALMRLCDPDAEVSAHYLISETGKIWQLVDETRRAWHAGVGQWGKLDDINSHSIGIELANRGSHPFAEPQMRALEQLLKDILNRWAIPTHRVIGHSDMAPTRKIDPGPRFDWQRLARKGLSIWPKDEISAAPNRDFYAALSSIGYPVETDGYKPCLAAFRARFRPWANGDVDQQDLNCACELARRFPVDAERATS